MALLEYKSLETLLADLRTMMSADAAADSMSRACEIYWSANITTPRARRPRSVPAQHSVS